MAWVVQLEEVIDGKLVSRTEVATVDRPGHLESLEDPGLRLPDAKPMLASIQRRSSPVRSNTTPSDNPAVPSAARGAR
jgi:hypothetical protein